MSEIQNRIVSCMCRVVQAPGPGEEAAEDVGERLLLMSATGRFITFTADLPLY